LSIVFPVLNTIVAVASQIEVLNPVQLPNARCKSI